MFVRMNEGCGDCPARLCDRPPGRPGSTLAQRFQQRVGGAHDELAERVVEIRPYQLQDKAQQDDQQVQAANGLQDINGGGIESGHDGSLLAQLFGQLGGAVGGSVQGFLDQGGTTSPGAPDAARAIGAAFVQRNLSPGGAADVLAAACWLNRLN